MAIIRIEQGTSTPVYASLKMLKTGDPITPRVVSEVEICVEKNLRKLYSGGEVAYDANVQQWFVVLTTAETAAMLPGKYDVQIRIKFRNGQWSAVTGTTAGTIIILEKGSCKACGTPAGGFADPVMDALLAEFPGTLQFGIQGDPGKSAYQYAVEAGYTGTEEEFAKKLASESSGDVDPEEIKKIVDEYLEENPPSGGSVDLTGYATEDWVKKGYQPKGEYLTRVPEGYAKISDIPQNPEDIGAQPAGNYALKSEIPSVPVQSVNGKTGSVKLYAEDVGALPSSYTPPIQTAEQVGADPKGTAAAVVSGHNTDTAAHGDIRRELASINARLTAFFDSDDQTLDELSEIVAYITSNKTLIEAITISKVSVSDIVDNLATNVANVPLSAAQGVILKALIDAVGNRLLDYQPRGDYALRSELPTVPTKVSAFANDAGYLTQHQDISGKLDSNKLPEAIDTALERAKESGEFDGYTPVRGTDYWTSADIQSMVAEAVNGVLAQKATILEVAYPVGAIYMSTVSTSPKTLFGFGTWEQIQDRFLLASGSTYAAGSTGGSATHTLTIDEMPSHTHNAKGWAAVADGSGSYKTLGAEGKSRTYSPDPTGGGQPHNNMPPYLAVYVWKRTA